jgi:hypothetical protein
MGSDWVLKISTNYFPPKSSVKYLEIFFSNIWKYFFQSLDLIRDFRLRTRNMTEVEKLSSRFQKTTSNQCKKLKVSIQGCQIFIYFVKQNGGKYSKLP